MLEFRKERKSLYRDVIYFMSLAETANKKVRHTMRPKYLHHCIEPLSVTYYY